MAETSAEAVAAYLKSNPDFFDTHADLIASLSVPNPHGSGAIPIAERQVIALRDRVRLLESKLAELVRFGEDNDAIGEKLHRLTLALIGAGDLEAALHVVRYHLIEEFSVPAVALRLWSARGPGATGAPDGEPVSEEAKAFAQSLAQPYICAQPMYESATWLGEGAEYLRSFAYVPLRARGDTLGLLALASHDPSRFEAGMGTLYLTRMGDLAGSALARLRSA